MRVLPILLVAVSALAAGCALPGASLDPGATSPDLPFADLTSTAAQTTPGDDGTLTLAFEGTSPGGVGALLTQREIDATPFGTFQVDERVGFVELQGGRNDNDAQTVAVILDDEGRIQCAALFERPCTVPVPGAAEWSVDERPMLGVIAPGTPVSATVILHPPSHMTRGDPLAGVDPTIKFHMSDTGVEGSEDNIGVLGDGSIFTQKGLNTMMSTDDGETWTNVAPPGNDRESLDPMLYVDPIRNLVLVDHLYVGCSVLSWSSDAGKTWTTNPAACGLPGDDHQKIATGPSPLPTPFPAVYYSFSSFAQGAWASRSWDGGLTFLPSPIVGLTDGRQYSNTGPIWADEANNVYVPYYMCDGEGYMGVGVSHDNGATWKFVVASEQPEVCSDVDPGLWSDSDGTVYLGYHRADGIYYVHSEDFGETWSAPILASPITLKSFVHVDLVAGEAGKIALVYRATPDSDKGPDLADGWAAWHLYVTFVENASSATPTIRTGIVNDPAMPLQRGPICTGGIGCVGGSRNLLDFIDIAVGPDGRVYPTFTSGCALAEACPTPADSRGSVGLVGIQESGPRLFAGKAPWAS